MGMISSQITSVKIVYSIVYSDADQRKHQSSASLAFVRGIHRWPVNSLHKWPVTRKIFPFDDIIMLIFIVNLTPMNTLQWHLNRIIKFSVKNMNLKLSSLKCWPFCPGPLVLKNKALEAMQWLGGHLAASNSCVVYTMGPVLGLYCLLAHMLTYRRLREGWESWFRRT